MASPAPTTRSLAAVLAGRRPPSGLDGGDGLPLQEVDRVRDEIEAVFRRFQPAVLISSAACGADILGLQAAEEVGVRARIFLPFDVEQFRRTSVTDRPGGWGAKYDHQIRLAQVRGDLVVLDLAKAEQPYIATNAAIIQQALPFERRLAILVWEGTPRGPTDATADLRQRALDADFELLEIALSKTAGRNPPRPRSL